MRLLRGLSGRVLGCGCLIGIYETYEGRVVATVDAQGPGCADPSHGLHELLPLDPPDGPVSAAPAAPPGAEIRPH